MINNKTLIIFCIFCISLSSCTSVKNALTGKKSENSDEFLINKKNPLVMPPDYDDLPEPKDAKIEEEEDIDIEKLIGVYNDETDQENNDPPDSTEKFVLENISKN